MFLSSFSIHRPLNILYFIFSYFISIHCIARQYDTPHYTLSKEMEFLITALTDRIEQSPLYLSGTHLASAVYGMQSMSSNLPHVRRLLKALADKMPTLSTSIRTAGNVLIPIPISFSAPVSIPSTSSTSSSTSSSFPNESQLHGLSSTASTAAVDFHVLEANSKVELCLSGQEIAMIMHGLRRMGSEWTQVSVISIQCIMHIMCYASSLLSVRRINRTLYHVYSVLLSSSPNFPCKFNYIIFVGTRHANRRNVQNENTLRRNKYCLSKQHERTSLLFLFLDGF